MSAENVEIVRRIYAAAARRDRSAVLSLYDERVELDLSQIELGTLTTQKTYHGHDGLRTMFRDWYDAFEGYTEGLQEVIDAGDHIITVVTGRGRGRTSRIDVDMTFFLLWTLREGKAARIAWYPSRGEVLDAARTRNIAPSRQPR